MSNGLCFAYRRTQSYSGTTEQLCFLDRDGNVAVELKDLDFNTSIIRRWKDIAFNDAGYCPVFCDRYGNISYIFDRSGAMVYKTKWWPYAPKGIKGEDSKRCYGEVSQSIMEFGSFDTVVEYGKIPGINYYSVGAFCGDYSIIYYSDHGTYYMAKIDNDCNIIQKKEIHCEDVTGIGDNYLIIRMANDYYGVVNSDLELLFEPVRERIWYMGDDIFLTASHIMLNAAGETISEWDKNWKVCKDFFGPLSHPLPEAAAVFSEGWCPVYYTTMEMPVYINEKGQIASFCGGDGYTQ